MKRSAKSVLAAIGLFVCGVLALKGSVLVVQSGSWAQTGNLSSARVGASAALLPDGRILVTGGDTGSGPVSSADFFATDGTISTAPAMNYARSQHVSVAMHDGRILVAGGLTAGGSATSTAEIFDPIANTWTPIGLGMTEARSGATAALLQDGRVAIAGGQNGSSISSTIEIFDPELGAFTSAGTMSSPRSKHAMTVLQDGRVLIVGGFNGSVPVAPTEIFDPVARIVSAGPSLAVARFGHSATTLLNGQVVVIGGNNGNANPAQMDATPAELLDFTATTPAFTTLSANLVTPREGHLALLLPNNNNVLIVGGTSGGTTVASAELFSPQESPQGVWTYGFGSTGAMTTARSGAAGSANQVNAPSTTMQRNGVLMVAGGNDANGNALNSTEAYGYPTVQTDQSDYPPGTTVTITGSGFQPNETVTIQLVESPLIDTHGPYTIQADANGNFVDTSFTTDAHDASVGFYLNATGGTSGFVAQNTFTDSKPDTVTVGTQAPNPVAPAGSAVYVVTVGFNGNGSACTSPLSIQTPPTLPTGANASFSPSSVTNTNPTSTLTITTTNATLPGSTTFTVLAGNGGGTCQSGTATGTGTLVVVENTTTLLASSVNPSTFGQSTTLTATVAQVTGPTTPTGGTVTFKDGAVTLGTSTLTAGTAILSTATLTAGSHSLTASYAGVSDTFGASNSNAVTQTVNQASTTTTVSSSQNPSVFSNSVTFTATVTDSSTGSTGTPTGTVTFKDGTNTLGTGPLNGSGVATFSTSLLSVASHSITAVYGGDTNFTGSTSSALSQTVNTRATTTTVSPSPASVAVGQASTITVTVTDGGTGTQSNPVGTIALSSPDANDTLTTCTLAPSGGNAATCTATVTPKDTGTSPRNITAVYTPSDNVHATSNGSASLNVNARATTTSVSLNPTTVIVGQGSTITVTVSDNGTGAQSNPQGTIAFTSTDNHDNLTFGTCTLAPSGVNAARCTAMVTPGADVTASESITATYTPNDNIHAASNGSSPLGVNGRGTSTSVTLTPSSVLVGQASTITVTITDNSIGTQSNPAGTVSFTSPDGKDTISGSPCTLSANSGSNPSTSSCTTTVTIMPGELGTSPRNITGTYNPSDNVHSTSNGAAALTISPRTTSTSINLNPNSVLVGQASTITVTVTDTSASGTASNPGGTIALSSPDTNDVFTTCTLAPSSGNAASCAATVTPKDMGTSPRNITATYTATDGIHSTSNGAASLSVSARSTSTSVSLNPASVGVNQSSTITVTVTDTGASGTAANPGGTIALSSPDANDTFTTCTLANSGANAATCTATVTPKDLGTTPRNITATYTPTDNVHLGSNGSAPLTVTQPDLTATKTDSVSGSTTLGNSWTWSILVKNIGTGSATFTANNQIILTDNLPGTNITYGAPATGNFLGITNSNQIGCSITSNTLTCVQMGNGQFVSIAAGGSFTVQFTATPSAAGTFANPLTGGTCEADPNNNVGESNLANNFCSDTVTVSAANTSTTITSTSAASGFEGQAVTVNFKVTNTSGTAVAPTGTVTVSDGTGDTCSGALTPGAGGASTGSCSLTPTTTGTKTVVASFPTSANFNASSSTGTTYTVNARTTSTTVMLTPASVTSGGSSTVAVTVADTAGAGSSTPAGTISFGSSDAMDTFSLMSCTLSSGSCSVTVTTHEVGTGSHTITATYTPNDNLHAGSSGNAALTVTARATTTTIAPTSASAPIGGSTQFTITVTDIATGTASNPVGTVSFTDMSSPANSDNISACALAQGTNPVGTVSCTVAVSPATPAGNRTINASFTATDGLHASSSTTTPATLNAFNAVTVTTVTSSANPSVFGEGVNFTATVTPQQLGLGLGTPAGTVQFAIDGSNFGSAVTLNASGSAMSGTTTTLSVGSHTITATYSPSAGSVYQGSNGSLMQTVNQDGSMTTIMSTPNPSTFDQTMNVTVAVTPAAPGSGTPTGSISFSVDGGTATVLALSGGTASTTVSGLTAGNHSFNALYSGEADFTTSMASANQMVSQATAAFSNLSASQSIPYGTASITLSGVISAPGPVYPPTSEFVAITINGVSVNAAIGANGAFSTSFDTHAIMASATLYTITYSYAGDTNFSAASDSSTTVTVTPATTQTTLASATNPSVLGQAVAFTAKVTDTSDSAVPNGIVSFYDGTTLIGSAWLNPSGQATFTTALLSSAASPHAITASFKGNADFSASMSSLPVSQAVTPRSTSTAVSLSPSTVAVGAASTATLTVTDAATTGPAGTPGVFVVANHGLNVGRTGHAATLLPKGTVLVVGGQDASSNVLASAEIYGPWSGTFTTAANSSNTARTAATATLLNNGTVLILGGSSDGTANGALTSGELYDPVAGTFTVVSASLNTARFGHTATLLANGKVLIAGGQNSSGALNSIELFDPSGPTFTAINDTLTVARAGHTATLLFNGTILFAGGSGLASAEIYDPVAHTSTMTGSMTVDRTNYAAVLQADGNVLLAGGITSGAVASTELYNTAAGTFTAAGNMTTARAGLTATMLNSAQVVVVGGSNSGNTALASAELDTPSFDPLGTVAATSSDNTDGITGSPCTLTLSGTGSTTCQVTNTPSEVGSSTHTLTGTYTAAPDQVHTSSNGSANLTVIKADTTTSVTSSANPSTYGQSVTFTAAVSVVSPGAGTPTGTANLYDGGTCTAPGTTLAAALTLSAGKVTFTTSTLSAAASPHTIIACYVGDSNFNGTGATAASTVTPLTQTVNPATLTITANSQMKVYGQSDPALTYTVSGFQLNDTAATVLTGALTRAPGETVTGSPYAITQGTLGANSNYKIAFTGSTLTITPATLTVTANPQTKTYGQADPTLTYMSSGFQFTDTAATVLTGALTRTPGETVAGSTYAISQGTLAANSNYKIAFTGSTLTITPATLTVTANPQTKTYGQADLTLTYMSSGFQFTDTAATVLTGALTRAPGEAVAGSPYAISQGTLAANSNYVIHFTGSTLTITPATLTIAANSQMKVYGGADPTLTYMSSGFQFTDTAATVLTGALTRAPGETVTGSPYAIAQGTLTANSNYNIAFTGSTLTITPATLTVTANPQTKTYGQADPTLTYISSGFQFTDTAATVLTGTLTRAPGEMVAGSPYAISQGTLAASSNYKIAFSGSMLTITPATLTITASSGSMIYGGPIFPVQPQFSGFVNGDTAASLAPGPTCNTTATSASPVGMYVSSCSGASDPNYMFNYLNGVVTINQASTTTAVISSVNPATFMQLVTFIATVTPQYAGTTPTGTVTFYNNGSQIGTGILSVVSCGTPPCADQATFSTTTLPDGGPDSITAVYSGDSNFMTSTSGALTETVQPAPNVSLNPLFISFGNQNVNTKSSAAKITLSNIGDAPLTINANGISIMGSNSNEFAQTNNCPSSLGFALPNNSCTIYVTFAPADTGVATASVQIMDNDDDASSTQVVSLTGAGLSTIMSGSLYTDALFASANGCGSITMSGGSTVDSFSSALGGYSASHVLTGGNVATDGNVTLNGSKTTIDGTAAVPSTTTGNCSKSSVTGLTSNGGAQVTGGLVSLNGSVNYPAPPAPNPAPPTTNQNISGSCPSGMNGCANNGTKNVVLAAGQYGNLNVSGGTSIHVGKGTYNVNSLTLSGNSILYVDSWPVVLNLAGSSLSGSNPVLDASGGSIQNPSGIAANFQVNYAGSRGMNLTGGSQSFAAVYAPNALINMSGGTDFFGSIIGSTITSSGGTAIHYDSSLPNIPAGDYIWFTAVVNNVQGLPNNSQVKLYLTNSSISFTAGGTNYNLPVPNAVVTFNSQSQTSGAKTSYDLANTRWSTAVSKTGLTGDTFVTAVAFPVPSNFPTGIQNAAWSSSFSTDTPGITLQWQWGAAVYSSLSTTYATTTPSNTNVLGVNAEDGSANMNGTDSAGTPETYKQDLSFGGTGGGLTNYTGFFSTGAGVVPTIAPMSVSPSNLNFNPQTQGTTSAVMTAVLTNNDSNPHSFVGSGIQIGGTNTADFTLVPNGPGTPNNCLSIANLASGASCTLYVTFTPSDVDSRTAKVVINDDANNSPQTVYLSGTGQ